MSKHPPPKMPPDPAADWRIGQVMAEAPFLLPDPGEARDQTLLYVGANPIRAQFLGELHVAGYIITVLEVFLAYRGWLEAHPWIDHVRIGDVRDLGVMAVKWDVTWWWHGPEHVPPHDLSRALGAIERHTADLVVLGCPWGSQPQGEVDGNPFQAHVARPQPEWFESHGYYVRTAGQDGGGKPSDHILAWKYLNVKTREGTP